VTSASFTLGQKLPSYHIKRKDLKQARAADTYSNARACSCCDNRNCVTSSISFGYIGEKKMSELGKHQPYNPGATLKAACKHVHVPSWLHSIPRLPRRKQVQRNPNKPQSSAMLNVLELSEKGHTKNGTMLGYFCIMATTPLGVR
jgi:hypothetical protein